MAKRVRCGARLTGGYESCGRWAGHEGPHREMGGGMQWEGPRTSCEICRMSGQSVCWAWHKFCRADLNPVALIQFIERQRLGVGGDVIVGYVYAVTGMDIPAFLAWQESERRELPPSADAVDPSADIRESRPRASRDV
jgi:hypothetical protein